MYKRGVQYIGHKEKKGLAIEFKKVSMIAGNSRLVQKFRNQTDIIHCKDKMPKICNKYVFPEKEYRGLSPNFHIHVSVSELYISTMGLPFLLEEICGPILGINKSLTDT
jgi:hypothetical protein